MPFGERLPGLLEETGLVSIGGSHGKENSLFFPVMCSVSLLGKWEKAS